MKDFKDPGFTQGVKWKSASQSHTDDEDTTYIRMCGRIWHFEEPIEVNVIVSDYTEICNYKACKRVLFGERGIFIETMKGKSFHPYGRFTLIQTDIQ